MKKKIFATAFVLLIAVILIISLFSANAAVYVQNGKFTFLMYNDGTVAWAGYTSDTVDDVAVPGSYDGASVVGVKNYGLENNSKIKSVDFMSAPMLNTIGSCAFMNCSSLEKIVIPNSITDIGESVFKNCKSLKYAEFYGNENSVPVEAFKDCSSLESVRLGARLESIQSLAFAGCSSLKYVELYDTVNYIANNAFDGADSVTLGVFKGTYALQYAIDNNISYIILDESEDPTVPATPTSEPETSEPSTVEPVTTEPATTEPATGEPVTTEPTEQPTTIPATPDEADLKLGDVNGDGVVDILDATEIQKYAAESTDFTDEQFELGDINKDGYCDVIDALLVQKSVIGAYEMPQNIIRY